MTICNIGHKFFRPSTWIRFRIFATFLHLLNAYFIAWNKWHPCYWPIIHHWKLLDWQSTGCVATLPIICPGSSLNTGGKNSVFGSGSSVKGVRVPPFPLSPLTFRENLVRGGPGGKFPWLRFLNPLLTEGGIWKHTLLLNKKIAKGYIAQNRLLKMQILNSKRVLGG